MIEFGRPRKHSNPEDSLIPLINIVFLLLIFFMVAGQVTSDQNREIEPPYSSSEIKAPIPQTLITLNANGVLTLDGEPIQVNDLKQIQDWSEREVSIKADALATAKALGPLLTQLQALQPKSVVLFSQSGAH